MSKLVRDKIPEIIKENGKIPIFHIASEREFILALDEKLDEEIQELRDTPDNVSRIEEIADVMEVLFAIAHTQGFSPEYVETIRLEKRAKRGAFEKGIILEKW